MDRNYINDFRVIAGERGDWFESFCPQTMKATVLVWDGDEEVAHEVHCTYTVCPTCQGKGKHTNPSIDSHGISSEEWNEWDEEDRETYMSGGYDVTCYGCKGNRVIPEICDASTPKHVLAALERQEKERADFEAESRMERMMGA